MSRRPPHHRRRPGRRPPNRYSGGHGPPRGGGFTGPGFRQAWSVILPGLEGPDKKRYFNDLSGGIILIAGACGAVLGLLSFGWIGAVLGLGGGVAAAGSFARSRRFHRD
jgi:hypothetical protein